MTMIWLGMKKDTAGYGMALYYFRRDGAPLSPKMCAALRGELDRARVALDSIEAAVRTSELRHNAKRRRGK